MAVFHCEHCGFETQDESIPECPMCGGYLSEIEITEDSLKMDNVGLEDEENIWGLNID